MFSYLIRYSLINYFTLNGILVFEIQSFLSINRRNLTTVDLVELIIGSFLGSVLNIILIILVIKVIISFKTIDKHSLLFSLKQGINPWRIIYPIIYYIHYFFIWYLRVILISLTPFVSSQILWLIILIIQVAFSIAQILKVLETNFLWFVNFLTETYITLVFAFCVACQSFTSWTDA